MRIRYSKETKRYEPRRGWYSIGGKTLTVVDAETLQGADLSNRFLDYADLQSMDLSHANLRGTSLVGADLQEANLTACDLRGAILTGANLERAILNRADLRNAALTWALLHGADLREANLADAELTSAYYGESTQWPKEFVPTHFGALLSKRKQDDTG